jgi:phenylpyruvate tautomerase PptA (4-oxalocrotonate tautomerase family)
MFSKPFRVAKDLVKFVTDACHDVLYANDYDVVVCLRVGAEKSFAPVDSAEASTKLEFRTLSST